MTDKFQSAVRAKDAGDLSLAERLCRQILANKANMGEAYHLLGTILHLRGKQKEAIDALSTAVQLRPSNAPFLITLGANYALMGRMSKAAEQFERAVSLTPSNADAQYNLGLAFKHLGNYSRAERYFRTTIALSPTHLDAMSNLAFTLIHQGRGSEAEAILQNALALNTEHASSLTNLGMIMISQGKFDDGEAMFKNAISLQPSGFAAYIELAAYYNSANRRQLAADTLQQLTLRFPAAAEAHFALAMLLLTLKDFIAAISACERALQITPHSAGAWRTLGLAKSELGQTDEAREALDRALAIEPLIGTKIQRELLLPSVMGTRDEVMSVRSRFEVALDKLLHEKAIVEDPLSAISFVHFFLAFNGENDLSLNVKIGRLYENLTPSLLYTARHCADQMRKLAGSKRRIGFYSHFIFKHSVSLSFGKVVAELASRDTLDIHLFSDSIFENADVAKTYPNFQGTATQVPRQLQLARKKIEEAQLDILVYLDIGMDPFTYLLAFARLAPIQCTMGGHPVTTGLRHMDYFLSPGPAEPANGDSHYSEKLVRLSRGGFCFERPTLPSTLKTRAELGLPADGHLYICPMMLQKIHPDFDLAINAILTGDPEARIILFESNIYKTWHGLLLKRFSRTVSPSLLERIIFLPWISDNQDFMRIIALSNVVLDPFHFGMGSTGIYVIGVGAPFVTLPGKFMRGRVGLAYCEMLDVMECVADDLDSYSRLAIMIANDCQMRDAISKKMLANSHHIFENDAAEELADILLALPFHGAPH